MKLHSLSSFSLASLCALGLWGLSATSHAAHPLITDDTGTQGAGHWQLEVNTDHTRTREADITVWERELHGTLTYGLTEHLDLALDVPWAHLSATGEPRQHGVGDVTVLAKWRFYDNGNGWSLGLRPEISLPSGSESKGLGNGRATASATLISTYESGPWTWLANVGYTYNDNKAGDRKNLWAASTAVLYQVQPQWSLEPGG